MSKEVIISEKDAAFLNKLLPGDILVMYSKDSIISSMIRWWTRSQYSHTATYTGGGCLIEAIYNGVRECHWSQTEYKDSYVVIALRKKNINSDQVNQIINFQRDKKGLQYDYPMSLFLAIVAGFYRIGINLRKERNWFNVRNLYSCIELVLRGYLAAGIRLVNYKVDTTEALPDDLINNSEGLEKVAEYIA